MTWDRKVRFGPNSDGWSIEIGVPEHSLTGDELIVEISGSIGSFKSNTYDSRNDFPRFASAMITIHRTLTGNAALETDHFEMQAMVAVTGQIWLSGTLDCYSSLHNTNGSISIEFEQEFDPITLETTMKQLAHIL